jgi:hypothetical protein
LGGCNRPRWGSGRCTPTWATCAAGLSWFLTDGKDPRREEAFAAMRERHGGGESLLGALGLRRVAIERFPEGAQEPLRALQAELGGNWEPPPRKIVPPAPVPWRVKLGVAGVCLTFVLVLVVPWLMGLSEIF